MGGLGWDQGWNDARAFWSMRAEGEIGGQSLGADTIGAMEVWVRKRIREWLGENEHQRESLSQWEVGFREGVKAFEIVVRR